MLHKTMAAVVENTTPLMLGTDEAFDSDGDGEYISVAWCQSCGHKYLYLEPQGWEPVGTGWLHTDAGRACPGCKKVVILP